MLITTNKIRVEGSVVYLTGNPIGGLIGSFTSFTDTTENITADDKFSSKTFRYTLNGVEWTSWQELVEENLNPINFDKHDTPSFEFAYTRALPDGIADVSEIVLDLTATNGVFLEDIFKNTIFSYFFNSNDPRILAWTLSVLKKIYDKGLLAPFVDRKNKSGSVEDFILLWKTIAQFFSFYVIYTREYEKFYENKSLLSEYLTQKGLVVSPDNTLEELYLLMKTSNKQFIDRGSVKIIDKKQDGKVINGELLRLINYRDNDEFQFNLHKTSHFGWNLGNSSPLYRGLQIQDNLLKKAIVGEENTFTVSGNLDYSVVLSIQTGDKVSINITSKNNNNETVSLYSANDGLETTSALSPTVLYRSDKIIIVRICLYNFEKNTSNLDSLNINLGNNIILNKDSKTVTLRVLFDDTVQDLNSLAIRFTPLFTKYSHGLIQVYNWISCWIENNNLSLSKEQIQAYIRQYLIPYNSVLQIELIDGSYPYNGDPEIITPTPKTLAWRPINANCIYTESEADVQWIGNPETAYCEQFVDNNIWIGDEETAECIQIEE